MFPNGSLRIHPDLKQFRRARTDFTLIELLIVISIIAIIASLLLPALNSARQKSLSASCISNQKQIGIANASYANDFNNYALPIGGGYNTKTEPTLAQICTEQKYISDRKVFFCPAGPELANNWKQEGYGRNCYIKDDPKGPNWSPYLSMNRPGKFFKWNAVTFQDSFTPSNFPFLTDTADFDANNTATAQPHYFYFPNPSSSKKIRKVHMRHTRRSNMLTLDGHVETRNYSGLIINFKFKKDSLPNTDDGSLWY